MKTLIIDAGHGGNDPGANGFGYYEKDLTLIVAKRVQELLKEYNPDLTRSSDITLEPTPRTNLIKNKYEYCISIHFNSSQSGVASGTECIYSIYTTKGKELAQYINDEIHERTGLKQRENFSKKNSKGLDYYYMHRLTGNTITIIVEVLFINNAEDIKLLNIESIAQGIAEGFRKFIEREGEIEVNDKEDTDTLTYNRVLKRGVSGNDVKELQRVLNNLGFYSGEIDGSFGPATEDAVKQFQKTYNLEVDGLVGPQTIGKINSLIMGNTKSKYYKIGDAHIIETTPDNIEIAILGNTLHGANRYGINGTFFNTEKPELPSSCWAIATMNGKPVGGNSMLVSYDKNIKRGTVIYFEDNTIGMAKVNNINEFWKPHIWCISGYTMLPYMDFEGEKMPSGINYKTAHTYLGYKDEKIYMIVKPSHMPAEVVPLLKQLNLKGCILLDGGGSSQLRHPQGSFTSTRKINTAVLLKEV